VPCETVDVRDRRQTVEAMNVTIPEGLHPYLPEAVLATGFALLLAVAPVSSLRKRAGDLALVVIALSAVAAVVSMDALQGFLVDRMVVVDPFAAFYKFVLSMTAMAAVWLTTTSRADDAAEGGLSWAFLAASLLGMFQMVSAANLVTAWAAFEVAGLGTVLWMGSRRVASDRGGDVLPSLLYGGAASAMMLVGFALLYGLAGTLEYAALPARLSVALAAPGGRGLIFVALLLVIVGVGSRIALVPWVAWRSGLAERTSLPVSAWLQTGGTLAALAMLVRFLRCGVSTPSVDGSWTTLPGVEWPALLSVAAMATMTLGNIAALRETNAKRLFAWLSVAQSGYLMMGIVVLSDRGLAATLTHGVAYAITMLGATATLALVLDKTDSDDLDALRGLARQPGGSRALALAMMVFLLSLAAVPPLAGYTGKATLFAAVFEASRSALGMVAALASLLGLMASARVVAILLDKPEQDAGIDAMPSSVDFDAAFLVGLLLAGTIGVGLWPAPLLTFVERSVVFFGG